MTVVPPNRVLVLETVAKRWNMTGLVRTDTLVDPVVRHRTATSTLLYDVLQAPAP